MLCGRISILSRIKWLFGYSFSRTKRPYETGKCHDCLWCEYIQQCMEDYKCMIEPEITGVWDHTLDDFERDGDFVYGETFLDELEREGDFR